MLDRRKLLGFTMLAPMAGHTLAQGPQSLGAFNLEFTVLFRTDDPAIALRPGAVDGINYNVPTWIAPKGHLADMQTKDRSAALAGDGFDDRILDQNGQGRTADIFNAAQIIRMTPSEIKKSATGLEARFPTHELFELTARVTFGGPYPLIRFDLRARAKGYYSVGFTGAPVADPVKVSEIWQPLIWSEQRVPDRAYLTLAFQGPLPTTLMRVDNKAYATIAHPDEFPFDPLPVFDNSRFGLCLKTADGKVSPSLFAPVLGGTGSLMSPGDTTAFRAYAVSEAAPDLTVVFEKLARGLYGFRDYRSNAISTLNRTLDHIVAYTMSDYAQWNKDLKGYSYETDVPGSVKNVSSLHALSLALATDSRPMFEERAYPLMEFVLSREKFLFALDREQKIQSPSRRLKGPVAPVSELTALSDILGPGNDFLLPLAETEYNRSRERNLDVVQPGKTWQNSLALYQATGDKAYLTDAMTRADAYIKARILKPQTKMFRNAFFWTAYVPDFTHLYMLYEASGEKRYLEAAHISARRYTMLMWMSPRIPDTDISVNKDGKAPIYWYLAGKGHKQMYAPKDTVPAWRLSEIGLTSESSGTSSGHRAIFMANLSPWLTRIGHDADDAYLQEVAKAGIIGRYRNFPGYHINTARTTIYEQEDYPLRDPKDLSVNSFHFNHSLPMASMLLDYLISDAYARSDGGVTFPASYIEGYAYLQNRFYGHRPGRFYTDDGVALWMPAGLVRTDSIELNYVAGYKGDSLYIAFSNQSAQAVDSGFTLDAARVELLASVALKALTASGVKTVGGVSDGRFRVSVPAGGQTVLRLDGVRARVAFADRFNAPKARHAHNATAIPFGNAQAYLFDFGAYGQRAYIYLRDDDSVFRSVSLTYTTASGETRTLPDTAYPFEFTIELEPQAKGLTFELSGVRIDGTTSQSGRVLLS